MVEFIHSIWPTAARWQMVGATFGVYIVFIVLFGVWYYVLYGSKPQQFLISSELASWQAKSVITQTERAISLLRQEIAAMEEVRAALASGIIIGAPATLPSGHKLSTYTYLMHSGQGDSQDRLCLNVSDESGVMLCSVAGPLDEELTRDYFIRWLDGMLCIWQSRLEGRNARLMEVSEHPDRSFNLLDFVYFSGITQTTVGYGDILPNSTVVRMVVLCQIILGYVLLAVILNLVLIG